MSIDRFFEFVPDVRVATIRPDGSLSGYDELSIAHFGGTVPNVGDVIGTVWNDKDYDFQTVQRRYFISEYEGERYWLLVVKDSERSAQLDALSTNVLLTTDLIRAVKIGRPEKEILARVNQLSREPDPDGKKIRPKLRKPQTDP